MSTLHTRCHALPGGAIAPALTWPDRGQCTFLQHNRGQAERALCMHKEYSSCGAAALSTPRPAERLEDQDPGYRLLLVAPSASLPKMHQELPVGWLRGRPWLMLRQLYRGSGT